MCNNLTLVFLATGYYCIERKPINTKKKHFIFIYLETWKKAGLIQYLTNKNQGHVAVRPTIEPRGSGFDSCPRIHD